MPVELMLEDHPSVKSIYLEDKNHANYCKSKYDSSITTKRSKWWIAPLEVISLNLLTGGYDAYILNEKWAKISFGSIGNNFKKGFVLDKDKFITNQFAHPFHGSQYFNIGRSNGYNFWESALFAFSGSLMWEVFMENESPSINDLASTTLGGIMLGEMSNKISSVLIDRKNKNRLVNYKDVIGSIFNFPRLVNVSLNLPPENLKYYDKKDSHKFNNLRVLFGFGVHDGGKVITRPKSKQYFLNVFYTYDARIRKRNTDSQTIKAYDYFRLRGSINYDGSNLNSSLFANGIIFGKQINRTFAIGIFQSYDYLFNQQVYKIGAQGAGLGFIYQRRFSKYLKLNFSSLNINYIILGAISSAGKIGERDYSFTNGAKAHLDLYFTLFENASFAQLSILLDARIFFLKTIDGIPGYHIAQFYNPRLIWDFITFNNKMKLGIGVEFPVFLRFTKYTVSSKSPVSFHNSSLDHNFFISVRF